MGQEFLCIQFVTFTFVAENLICQVSMCVSVLADKGAQLAAEGTCWILLTHPHPHISTCAVPGIP